MATNPMEQFKVHKIGPEIEVSGINLSFTNASLFMVISAGLILVLLLFGTRQKNLVPGKMQLISEMLYNFISKMINSKLRTIFKTKSYSLNIIFVKIAFSSKKRSYF